MTTEQILAQLDSIFTLNATSDNNQLLQTCNLEGMIRRWRSPMATLLSALQESTDLDDDLTAIADLTGTGLLKKTAPNTWTFDTNVYLTEIPASGLTPGTYGSSTQVPVFTANDEGRITSVTLTTISAGITSIGTVNTPAKNSDGAVISGSALYMQDADTTFRGLINSGAQTLGGANTFNGIITANAANNTFGTADFAIPGGTNYAYMTMRSGNNIGAIGYGTSPAGSYLGMSFLMGGTVGGTYNHSHKFRFYAGDVSSIQPFTIGTTSAYVYSMDFPAYHDVSVCMFGGNSSSRYYRIKTDNTSIVATERFAIQGYANLAIAYFNNLSGLGINTTSPQASALLDVVSTTQGTRPYPRMTAAQRTAIAVSASTVGLHVYQTDGTEGVYIYKSTGWALAY